MVESVTVNSTAAKRTSRRSGRPQKQWLLPMPVLKTRLVIVKKRRKNKKKKKKTVRTKKTTTTTTVNHHSSWRLRLWLLIIIIIVNVIITSQPRRSSSSSSAFTPLSKFSVSCVCPGRGPCLLNPTAKTSLPPSSLSFKIFLFPKKKRRNEILPCSNVKSFLTNFFVILFYKKGKKKKRWQSLIG